MSTEIKNVFLQKGSTFNYICKDGLSPFEMQNYIHIGKLLNFDGSIQFKNCGPGQEWLLLKKAAQDMRYQAENLHGRYKDPNLTLAYRKDYETLTNFRTTRLWTNWENTPSGSEFLYDQFKDQCNGFDSEDAYSQKMLSGNDKYFCKWGGNHPDKTALSFHGVTYQRYKPDYHQASSSDPWAKMRGRYSYGQLV